MNTVIALIKLSRAQFTIEPVVRATVGAFAYAYDHDTSVDPRRWALACAIIFLTNVAINYYNDYNDYEGDKANATRSTKTSTGGSNILVAGLLPRWTALAASLLISLLILTVILLDRHLHPSSTPFCGANIFWGCVFMGLSSQYNAGLRLSYTPFCEVLTVGTLSVGSWLFGYNAQDPAGGFVVPVGGGVGGGVFLLDAVLQMSRIMVMQVVDTDADRFVGKITLTVHLGPRRVAEVYLYLQYAILILAAFLACTSTGISMASSSPVAHAMVGVFAAVVLPRTFVVAKKLRRLGEGVKVAAEDCPFEVSRIMIEVNLACLAVLGAARGMGMWGQ
ncbi:hypothetical protein SAICODRAFT_27068 [Saitoella complicata NRRL Y-17804]|uniref:1,4-dihydroxy-2-naphthoate octaprenyltransferase n=1 Tax=Saitoella complicata (strain BCRC 22490 / CBS 7301 / JCM 7358 / NBRC 10748 / NRRL Y-17804) TaxID=698492 RepID=A0A0E9NJP2_SAICN|nr:uncharacterized protein SAICODRAFT_27068 [Saitoella complicata NRRL Y-17804]ODQ51003.1 hypothetical protein SAICODRAFT_27068 [Saitoella complicata NRRL Y-17804]GAO49625.1 hypothetical protein G7K_3774-t1 [Saitoella complicata NRRL Y-17804]